MFTGCTYLSSFATIFKFFYNTQSVLLFAVVEKYKANKFLTWFTGQFHHILVPTSADPHGVWNHCKINPAECSPNQMDILQGHFCFLAFLQWSRFAVNYWSVCIKHKTCPACTTPNCVSQYWLLEYITNVGFRLEMLNALRFFIEYSRRGGLFINSCFAHCQSESEDTWSGADSPRVNNKVHNYFFLLSEQLY